MHGSGLCNHRAKLNWYLNELRRAQIRTLHILFIFSEQKKHCMKCVFFPHISPLNNENSYIFSLHSIPFYHLSEIFTVVELKKKLHRTMLLNGNQLRCEWARAEGNARANINNNSITHTKNWMKNKTEVTHTHTHKHTKCMECAQSEM